MMHSSKAQLADILPAQVADARPPTDLLQDARRRKAYDAYHSSSIEGYRLRLEEVSRLLQPEHDGGVPIEDVASRMAVLGYGKAFDSLIARMESAAGSLQLSRNLALDVYADLFTPSVEAGLVDRQDLRRFRIDPVFIRKSLFVPPNAEKIPAMIDLVFDEINEMPGSQGLMKAVLVHLWFVWVHPFPDGNGRISRFLMNAALLRAGQPWLTIRVEQRDTYFRALRRAQLDEDYVEFGRFILGSAQG